MTIEDVDRIYSVLDQSFAGRYMFARGGYYSLLKQGILKQSREIGDLDINILKKEGYYAGGHWLNIQTSFVNFAHDFRVNSGVKDFRLEVTTENRPNNKYDVTDEEDEEGDNVKEEPIKDSNELNSFLTISLKLLERKSTPKTTLRGFNVMDLMGNDFDYTISTTSSYTNMTSGVDPRRPPNPAGLNQITPSNVAYIDKQAMQSHFIAFMAMRCLSIKMDLFFLEVGTNSNKVKLIGNELYTSPYVILSAKHRYCSNIGMAYPIFLKHIGDLEDSFSAIRIKGVNYPEDTFLLRENRRISDEQKGK